MKHSLISISLLCMLFLLSCKKHMMYEEFYKGCENEKISNSELIIKKLAGKWKWKKHTSAWVPYWEVANKQIFIEFMPDATYIIKESDSVIHQGKYELVFESEYVFELEVSDNNRYMYGYVTLCGDLLSFNRTHNDGEAHLFQRKD